MLFCKLLRSLLPSLKILFDSLSVCMYVCMFMCAGKMVKFFVITNSIITLALGSMFVWLANSANNYDDINTIAVVGSVLLASFSIFVSIGFLIYGSLLIRMLKTLPSFSQASRSGVSSNFSNSSYDSHNQHRPHRLSNSRGYEQFSNASSPRSAVSRSYPSLPRIPSGKEVPSPRAVEKKPKKAPPNKTVLFIRRMYFVCTAFVLCFMCESLVFAFSALDTDTFVDNFVIFTCAFLSFDTLALCCLLFMFRKSVSKPAPKGTSI